MANGKWQMADGRLRIATFQLRRRLGESGAQGTARRSAAILAAYDAQLWARAGESSAVGPKTIKAGGTPARRAYTSQICTPCLRDASTSERFGINSCATWPL